MKKRALKIFFVLETLVIVLELLCLYIGVLINKNTELFREYSPDGKYVLYIKEIGTPAWPFGPDRLEINLYEAALPVNSVSFRADVSNDGARAGYKVTWLEDGVQIALIGSEQPTAYYILLFMTMEGTKGAQEDTASEDALLTEEETMQKKDVVNEELQSDLQSIIDETRLAAESHEMEHANNIFKILHDMDYFLLRYGLDDVGKYSRDDSFIGTYYGTLSFYK